MQNYGNKAAGIIQKLFRYRLKIDRKGTPILNVSSIFALACLLFAPHMSIVGIAASLLLGYHINLESEGHDMELEEKFRKAADSLRSTAVTVGRTIRTEVQKARNEETNGKEVFPAQAVQPDNQTIMQELEKRAGDFTESNPAATTFHSAYSASAGSVPTLRVEEKEEEVPPAPHHQQKNG